MKRIAILTAGGDTPALNATIHGAVERANQLKIEMLGIIKGYGGLLNPEVPHVHLNPLFHSIPELDVTRGGTILGASRNYVSAEDHEAIEQVVERLKRLRVDGLICVGGDGTLNGMQAISERIPSVLAPKTIDNDLGLNYADEVLEYNREPDPESPKGYRYTKRPGRDFTLDEMVHFVTPGYPTSVFVSAQSVQRVRTTAESHRRIAIIEVMGRDCGMIALGTAYGQPDMILVPEVPVDPDRLVQRVEDLLELQKHAVICVAEGIKDVEGHTMGAVRTVKDPAGNIQYSGAAEAIKQLIAERLGDSYFAQRRRHENVDAAIFCRKVGHTQRGGRPILFDRYHGSQLGGEAVDLLVQGLHNSVATLKYDGGVLVQRGIAAHRLLDRWNVIHARPLSTTFYDADRFKPSPKGIAYLQAIFNTALGSEDLESQRHVFDAGNLHQTYDSANVHVSRRIRRLSQSSSAD